MPAYIARPVTVFPPHKVTTDEIIDDIRDHHPDHQWLRSLPRIIANLGVNTRYFTRPLDSPTIAGTAGMAERSAAAFQDALDLAEQAARQALNTHSLEPADIDTIITTHSTGWSVPNLDIHLMQRLGLRPHTKRIALTTMACAGGVQALIRAVDMTTARPGTRTLVVAAETISAVYNHTDTAIEHMIYKALFGDSAAATIVTDQPHSSGLRVNSPADTYEHVLPGSLDRYQGRADHAGFHFDSTKAALTAADDVLPHLLDWLDRRTLIDWAAIHPGSPRIITDTAHALGLDAHDTHHSTDTLADEGNLGGPSVLRILERTHDNPPHHGSTGVLVAYGPGFNTAAIRGTWHH